MTDIPIDIMDAMVKILGGAPEAIVDIDCEGSYCRLIFRSGSTTITKGHYLGEQETCSNYQIPISVLAEEVCYDIDNHLDGWVTWMECGERTAPDEYFYDREIEIRRKLNAIQSMIGRSESG